MIAKSLDNDIVNLTAMVADAERRVEQAELAVGFVAVGHEARIVVGGVDYALHLTGAEALAALVPVAKRLQALRDARKAGLERHISRHAADKPAE